MYRWNKKSAIKVNKDALFEYERLKQNDLLSTIKRSNISDDAITVFVHKVRSLSKHTDDIVSDDRIINNDIIGIPEIQIRPWYSVYKIMETLNFFNIKFNNHENKFLLGLAYGYRNNSSILDKFDANRVSILASRNILLLTEWVFILMLVYRKQSIQMQETCFCRQSIHLNLTF